MEIVERKIDMSSKVVCFGSFNYDNVYSVNNIVKPGETTNSKSMEQFCGGKGLNQAIALSRAGVDTYMAGLVGLDGDALVNKAKENNIDISMVTQIEGKSGHAVIQIDKRGQNSILLYGGANQKISKEYVLKVLSEIESGDLLVLQNEISMLPYIIDKASEKGIFIVLNPSPFNEKIGECDINKVDILILNEIEGAELSGKSEYKDIINELYRLYPNSKIVLTLGAEGSMYIDKNSFIYQECIPSEVVDTTAAGDTFTGYFLASLLFRRETPQQAMKIASLAASIAVSKKGASDSIPSFNALPLTL